MVGIGGLVANKVIVRVNGQLITLGVIVTE